MRAPSNPRANRRADPHRRPRLSFERLESRLMLSTIRPPAVPLVVNDPYLSIWSDATNLTDDVTRLWTGSANSLVSLIRVDGVTYRLMGDDPSTVPAMPQVNLQVLPTRTIYDFDNSHIHVTLTFLTPKLPDNLDAFAEPVTYLNWSVYSVDGSSHLVQIYDSTSSELAVNTTDQVVQWSRQTAGPLTALDVGTTTQTTFSPAGDEVGIDWGYAYAAANTSLSTSSIGADASLIAEFQSSGVLSNTDDTTGPRAVNTNEPVMAFAFNLGLVNSLAVSRHVEVAYDEVYSIDYFGANLQPYWRRNGATPATMLQTADLDFDSLMSQCVTFDQQLMADLTAEGGSQYAQLAALAYRQSLGACGLAADANGQPLFFTKENTSNGDISTVDVIFPMSPILLLFSPELMKAALTPVLDYSASTHWTFSNAPHDLGTYPVATGRDDGGEAMPVEESANMIIMIDALAKAENSAEFASKYWTQLSTWANFLIPYAVDPGNQLTTDDFLGTIDHSTNLAVKAIEALGAYAQLAQMLGESATAASYTADAQSDVTHWMSVSANGNHYSLAYNDPGTWSELYNLVWDRILGLNLFPASVASEEVAYYESIMSTYGVPVESTTTTAKTDWQFWSASLATNNADFETLIAPIYNFMNTTTNRAPLQDSYDVTNVGSSGFDARPVVGGLFVKMLTDPVMWAKYATAGANTSNSWAPFPQTVTVVPTSQTTPQTWRYTTTTPAGTWMDSGFNDSSWSSGNGAFGTAGTPGISPNTTWNTSDIWIRRTFTMPTGTFSDLQFLLYHDEDIQVYLNGVLGYSAAGYITSYQTDSISAAALAVLTPGATITLAVHCHQTVGGQGVDVGLVNIEQYVPVVPTSQATPQTWRYTTATPSGSWMNSGFNDSSWTSASGAFGTAGITPGIFPNTTWNTSDIWLIQAFTMPTGTFSNLEFVLFHDEDIQVYLNGVLAYSAAGYITSYQTDSINSAALAVLTPGATITLAVHCHQTVGGQGVDVGIVNVAQYGPLVSVNLTYSGMSISPASPNLTGGASQQFTAAALDQFGQVLATQPPITWTLVSGPGLLSDAGLYTPPYASGSAVVQASSGAYSATAAVTFSSEAQWNASSDSSWTTSGNWIDAFTTAALAAPGVRGLTGDTVLFASAPVARLDGATPTLAGVTFNNAASGYGIIQGSGGSLTLQGASTATVSVLAGSPAINAPVHLASNTTFSAAASTTLTMMGPIDGIGSLTMTGMGKLLLNSANTFSGGLVVQSGTVVINAANGLRGGCSLIVGSGAASLFGSVVASAAAPPRRVAR
jgi:autotransporter-associated beta strand protein